MTTHIKEFPFVEHSRLSENGDQDGEYAHSPHELRKLGYDQTQIWSVVMGDDDELDENGERWLYMTYGPTGHYVNVIGYIGTIEHHDNDTYYQEAFEMLPLSGEY